MTSHFDRKEPGKFRLLLLSQDISDVRENLPKDTTTTLQLQERENKIDIDAYISASAEELPQRFDLDEDMVHEVIQKLCTRIRG